MSRKQGEFWAIPKTVMAMKHLTLQARVVYAILWTRANGENEAWPGQKSIADDLGIGERSVRRYIDELRKESLVEVEKKGLGRTNRYTLIGQIGLSSEATVGLSSEAIAVASPIIGVKRTEEKNIESPASKNDAKEIVELIDGFQTVDPNWNRLFARVNQRNAINRMLERHGRPVLEKIIAFLPKNNADPYAPKITNPIQLEENLGRMKAHWQQKKSRNKNVIGIAL